MLDIISNVFKIKDLRNKILFTLGMLVVYRIGFAIPIPGVDQSQLASVFEDAAGDNAFGRLANFMSVFSGGSFSQSTIFGLGIMPYITASIIFQLFGTVSPQLKKLREEGPTGYQRIMEWTRYVTVLLCIIQGSGWLTFITRSGLVYPTWVGNPLWWVMALTALTAGTMFLMWLGEQIDRHGIGNGVSLIIAAGILAEMPSAITWIVQNFSPQDPNKLGWAGLLLIVGGFVLVVAGAVVMTVAQRRIPVQQAKHQRGRTVVGGQKSYLPLKINHGGVMPIIFASSLMILPSVVFSAAHTRAMTGAPGWLEASLGWMADAFRQGAFPYVLLFIVMTFFFSYFWITVQFNPEEMSKQLRDHGSFIPGLRPGPRTAEYLETVMERVTYVGAGFLAIIAVIPMIVADYLSINFRVAQFLGGTGLLIVVSVVLDFLQRVEAAMLMRNYAGFLSGEDGEKPSRRAG